MSLEISYITYIVINDYAHIKTYTKDEIGTFSRLTDDVIYNWYILN